VSTTNPANAPSVAQVPRRRLAVLVSGSGSNLAAILRGCADATINADVVQVVSNRPGVLALSRATDAGVPHVIVHPSAKRTDRRAYDHELAERVAASSPDWVVLAGWMRLLSSTFLDVFPDRVINLHPALPGEFPGAHAIDDAWQAHEATGLARTGVMVHLVPDEGVDDGPVLASAEVAIEPGDTIEALTERIHATEHRILVDVLARLCANP
jgi:phosphoribosylglycinamide formyltransferase 1